MPEEKLTVDQFAEKIKTKYPQYKDLDNGDLTKRMLEKYPEYGSSVDTTGALKKYSQPKGFFARIKWLFFGGEIPA